MSSNLIGKTAPYFCAKAVQNGQILEDFSLRDLTGSYVVFFFYPLDFTFVCPTELHAFQEELHEFEKRNCKIVACSVDSVYSHLAWLKAEKKQGGIQGITYPLVSDLNKTICRQYHVLKEDEGIAYRGLYLLDKQGMIRHMVLNDLSIGRSVDEVLRTLDALIFHENHGDVCPANWKAGEKAFKADHESLMAFFE
jgi:peroxiredoxin (alkyl hydroperoxide reductase subunit C)